MTMDGHASNVSMCTQLGCDLKADPCDPSKTHFPHSVTHDNVFVTMDACHMLKLTCNMLQVHAHCCIHYCTYLLWLTLYCFLDILIVFT